MNSFWGAPPQKSDLSDKAGEGDLDQFHPNNGNSKRQYWACSQPTFRKIKISFSMTFYPKTGKYHICYPYITLVYVYFHRNKRNTLSN